MNVLECEHCRRTTQRPIGWYVLSEIKPSSKPAVLNVLLGADGDGITADLAGTFCTLDCAITWLTEYRTAKTLLQQAQPEEGT